MEDNYTESYTFSYSYDIEGFSNTYVRLDFKAQNLNEVVEAFVDFLRRSGFTQVEGVSIHTCDGSTVDFSI